MPSRGLRAWCLRRCAPALPLRGRMARCGVHRVDLSGLPGLLGARRLRGEQRDSPFGDRAQRVLLCARLLGRGVPARALSQPVLGQRLVLSWALRVLPWLRRHRLLPRLWTAAALWQPLHRHLPRTLPPESRGQPDEHRPLMLRPVCQDVRGLVCGARRSGLDARPDGGRILSERGCAFCGGGCAVACCGDGRRRGSRGGHVGRRRPWPEPECANGGQARATSDGRALHSPRHVAEAT
mmetsp:Transcript_15196/g.39270  ORF Transcript_15196/g.39270 Transcript_15196/m.39270 type:complete len:238 (+) Transcript_15196:1590-2303(+)